VKSFPKQFKKNNLQRSIRPLHKLCETVEICDHDERICPSNSPQTLASLIQFRVLLGEAEAEQVFAAAFAEEG
jgi:hypothetical protein